MKHEMSYKQACVELYKLVETKGHTSSAALKILKTKGWTPKCGTLKPSSVSAMISKGRVYSGNRVYKPYTKTKKKKVSVKRKTAGVISDTDMDTMTEVLTSNLNKDTQKKVLTMLFRG